MRAWEHRTPANVNYQLLSPDELLLNAAVPASEAFVYDHIKRLRKKHHNDKRHREKHRKR